MTIDQLCEAWKSGHRQLWYSYDGLFGSVKVWNALDKLNDSFRDCFINQLIACHNLINIRIPIYVHLHNLSTQIKQYEFTISWDIFLPDICGRNSIGIHLQTADNNENIFASYKDCADWCDIHNTSIIFNSSMIDSIFYINLLKRLLGYDSN